jgi:hypothetical protein
MAFTTKLVRFAIAAYICLVVASACVATTNTFTVTVPKRTAKGNPVTLDVNAYPIMKMKVIVQVDTDNPVTFSIQDPWGGGVKTIGPLSPGGPATSFTFFTPAPAGASVPADVVIFPPSAAAPTDPSYRKYILLFDLNADFNLGVPCTGVMSADEPWTISATGGNFTKVCVQSINSSISGATSCPSSPLGTVPISGKVAGVGGLPNSMLGCRPGLDCILVLDHSGSMQSQDLNPMGSQPKINSLHTSVTTLVQAWDAIRTLETSVGGTPPINSPNDQIGVILFDTNADWWSVLGAGLNSFPTAEPVILANINNVSPNTNTAIGKGLQLADPVFPAAPDANRHVVFLMTDGIQNTDPYIGVDSLVTPTQILTYFSATPSVTTPLPHQNNYQVYVTSIGTSTAVDPSKIQPLATAGRGFYTNAETDSAKLNTFFTEGLQNFLQFSTQQTVRIIGDSVTPGTPYVPARGFPLSTTSQSAVFVLTWDVRRSSTMKLTITPPGGGKPIVKLSQDGTLILGIPLPPPAPYDPLGNWNIQIDAGGVGGVIGLKGRPAGTANNSYKMTPVSLATNAAQTPPNAQPVPFNFIALADDVSVNSKLAIVPGDYAPTDLIKLQVNVTEFGQSVKNIGTVVAKLVKPGVSIGDLLSQSTAGTNPTNPGDTGTPAQNKLDNTLQANPSLLATLSDTVTLYDDGKPQHGDAKAGDGIYSALYPSQLPGHYNFLFLAEGKSKSSGNFSRMQFQTVYVHSAPDGNNTAITANVTTAASGNTLNIIMTPRTKAGDRMGPGWANYFWFTATGQTPFKPKDNLDGTYTAALGFTGSRPPAVALHFLHVPVIIVDSVTPSQLPVPLGNGNVVIKNVLKSKNCWEKLFGTMLFPLLGGFSLIGLVAYLPKLRRKT